MSINLDKKLKNSVKPGLVQKTFVEHRDRLLQHARTYYRSQINDFSETSVGGMLLDFAALVGDSMSFYIDQQLNELDYEKAINPNNINSHLRRAGIKAAPPSPAVANVTFTILIKALDGNPDPTNLPVIKRGTVLGSTSGINFMLTEDLDFTDMNFTSKVETNLTEENVPLNFIISKKALCVSGDIAEETVFMQGTPGQFLSYTLQNPDVNYIEKVVDSDLNEYYEVDFLSQDTIYKKVENSKSDYFEVVPAPYRFTREEDFNSGITSLRFGNGSGKSLKDDVLVNPEDLSLPLLGRNYTSRFSLDPQKLLTSLSLGISPAGKSVVIRYMYGGGINHNVSEKSINQVINSTFSFPNIVSESNSSNLLQMEIINSLAVTNENKAIGGTDGFSIDALKIQIPNALKMQSRVITHKDLLARLYTMPANFGRIHKAAVVENPYTQLTKDLYIVCKDIDGYYTGGKDVLKINIQKYLNEFRLIGDTFNIIDSPIINFGIKLNVKIRAGFEVVDVLEELKVKILENMRFDTLQIGEAININDIFRTCLGVNGVLSVVTDQKDVIQIYTNKDNRIDNGNLLSYNNNPLDVKESLDNGLLFPPPGAIFELKYSAKDIRTRGT